MQRLIAIEEVLRRVTLGRSKLYDLIKRREFPPPVKITPSRSAWLEAEIDAWIAERIALRDGGDAK